MKTMTPELFNKYKANPLQMDEEVRKQLDLPDNRYYTVSMWPVEGVVNVTRLPRDKQAKKISKSDQK